MYTIIDKQDKEFNKECIDSLFYELNSELRRRFRRIDKSFKANLYVVGGACIVTQLQSRESTCDIDAMWDVGNDMRECINAVGDRLELGHTWCNCDFKRTKSYTDAIVVNSHVYKEFDRLIVRMVNFDLLLAMKLVAFRLGRKYDLQDIVCIIGMLRMNGVVVDICYINGLMQKYYNGSNLSDEVIVFLRSVGCA